MLYLDLIDCYKKLESTSKRLEKIFHISTILKKTDTKELGMVTLLLQGRVFPLWSQQKLGVATRIIIKALSIASGKSVVAIDAEWKNVGDLGVCAQNIIKSKTQSTLGSFMAVSTSGKTFAGLNLEKVFSNFEKLSVLEGDGTVGKKVNYLADLLTSASPIEARFIVRTVIGELRVGAAEGVLRDAIVHAFFPSVIGIVSQCPSCKEYIPSADYCPSCYGKIEAKSQKFSTVVNQFMSLIADGFIDEAKVFKPTDVSDLVGLKKYDFILCESESAARDCFNYFVDTVQRAFNYSNDFGMVSVACKENSVDGLSQIKLEVGKPVKAMLYPKAKDIAAALDELGTPVAVEYKYDGFRIQVHVQDNDVRLFTRRLEEVTYQFPDVKEAVIESLSQSPSYSKDSSFIFDGEIVGLDPLTKRIIPFQKISQRIKRKYDINKMVEEVPVIVHLFDVMFSNGKMLIDEPFQKRRNILEASITPIDHRVGYATQLVVSNVDEAREFYEKSLSLGYEGVMVKGLDAPYKPGTRVGFGMKVKPVMETLDLVVTSAEWGEGKRSEWLSSFNLSCQDDEGNLLDMGKVGTGIKEKQESPDDITFDRITEFLKPLITKEDGKTVLVQARLIFEIAYEEIQTSTTYSSGYALRFPRVIRMRIDKPVNEISDIKYIEQLYHTQRGKENQ